MNRELVLPQLGKFYSLDLSYAQSKWLCESSNGETAQMKLIWGSDNGFLTEFKTGPDYFKELSEKESKEWKLELL